MNVPQTPGGNQSRNVLIVVSESCRTVSRTTAQRVLRMPLAFGFCILARRTISKQQATLLPEPTGPMMTRIFLSDRMNRSTVGVGV